jgi:hypothetical protein
MAHVEPEDAREHQQELAGRQAADLESSIWERLNNLLNEAEWWDEDEEGTTYCVACEGIGGDGHETECPFQELLYIVHNRVVEENRPIVIEPYDDGLSKRKAARVHDPYADVGLRCQCGQVAHHDGPCNGEKI